MAKYLTIKQFREKFGIGHTKTYELIGEKKVRAIKFGARTLIDAESAENYFEALPEFVGGFPAAAKSAKAG